MQSILNNVCGRYWIAGRSAVRCRSAVKYGRLVAAGAALIVSAVRASPPLPAIVAEVVGPTRIDLSWDSLAGIATYQIYWSDRESRPVAAQSWVPGTECRFQASALGSSTRYWFWVQACTESDCGEAALVSAATPDGDCPRQTPFILACLGDSAAWRSQRARPSGMALNHNGFTVAAISADSMLELQWSERASLQIECPQLNGVDSLIIKLRCERVPGLIIEFLDDTWHARRLVDLAECGKHDGSVSIALSAFALDRCRVRALRMTGVRDGSLAMAASIGCVSLR